MDNLKDFQVEIILFQLVYNNELKLLLLYKCRIPIIRVLIWSRMQVEKYSSAN